MNLRDYQQRAVDRVRELWAGGCRRVCLVAPTGSGKTIMGAALAGDDRVIWLTHRRELITQTVHRLSPHADVFTVQSLLNARPDPSTYVRVIIDEAHHYAADEWKTVAQHYSHLPTVGLTATPERADGRPLGDMFDEMVVAAQYSELLAAGHLVPCKVFRAEQVMERGELSTHPLSAYNDVGGGGQGFLYARSVEAAHGFADALTAGGVPAAGIDGAMPMDARDIHYEAFRAGQLRMLSNVFVLTEGVDVPQASVCMLARRAAKTGPYLQMVGRVLRPHPDKEHATLIDLCGSSYWHGMPTDDRLYSLHGSAIRSTGASTKTCPECSVAVVSWEMVCPECGYQWPEPEPPKVEKPKIWSHALKQVYAGDETPAEAKDHEWQRLVRLCMSRNWSLSWALKQYQRLFPDSAAPRSDHATQVWEYRRLAAIAAERGYKPGWAAYRFKTLFGNWPGRDIKHAQMPAVPVRATTPDPDPRARWNPQTSLFELDAGSAPDDDLPF